MGFTAAELNARFYAWLNLHFMKANETLRPDSRIVPRFDGHDTIINVHNLRYCFSFSDIDKSSMLHIRSPSRLNLEGSFAVLLQDSIAAGVTKMNAGQRAIYNHYLSDVRCYLTSSKDTSYALDINLNASFATVAMEGATFEGAAFPTVLGNLFSPIHVAVVKKSRVT